MGYENKFHDACADIDLAREKKVISAAALLALKFNGAPLACVTMQEMPDGEFGSGWAFAWPIGEEHIQQIVADDGPLNDSRAIVYSVDVVAGSLTWRVILAAPDQQDAADLDRRMRDLLKRNMKNIDAKREDE